MSDTDKKQSGKCSIGLETHLQLNTNSKLFCGCSTNASEEPNSSCCEICLGHPGSKPMFNGQALLFALKLSIALGCEIEPQIVFSRKTYFYPDMSKNFQITQYEVPLGKNGSVKLKNGKVVTIQRIHLEEDPAALVHPQSMQDSQYVLIDYNRSGIPLCEIVTAPVMSSPAEAREFLKELLRIVKYLHIFDENTGVMKADLNISIPAHPRVEVKNVSGFKEAEKALNYELVRQRMALKKKEKAVQHTRGWDGKKTFLLRTKETEEDYGYIIEPDLPTITISPALVQEMKQQVPELAHVRSARYIQEHQLNPTDAEVMAMELELAELFEKVAAKIDPKLAAKWLRRELLRVLNYNKKTLSEVNVDEKHLIELLQLVQSGAISETTAQHLMEKLIEKSFSPKEYVRKQGLMQITGEEEIGKICRQVVKDHPKAVEDYNKGEKKALQYLVGQVMKLTKGKAKPEVVNQALQEQLKKE